MADSSTTIFEHLEAFAFFDGDRDGRINKDEFEQVLRALGHAPTEAEMNALKRSVERIYGGTLTFPQFVKVVSSIVEAKIRPPGSYASSVEAALHEFNSMCRDRSGGEISVADMKLILTRHGDALDEAAFLQLLRTVSPKSATASGAGTFGSKMVILPSLREAAAKETVPISRLVDATLMPAHK